MGASQERVKRCTQGVSGQPAGWLASGWGQGSRQRGIRAGEDGTSEKELNGARVGARVDLWGEELRRGRPQGRPMVWVHTASPNGGVAHVIRVPLVQRKFHSNFL